MEVLHNKMGGRDMCKSKAKLSRVEFWEIGHRGGTYRFTWPGIFHSKPKFVGAHLPESVCDSYVMFYSCLCLHLCVYL